jgi:hypothetical protein
MPGMAGMFIAKHFQLGTPAKLDISFLEHENGTQRTAAESASEVLYPEVSHFEQTRPGEVS